MLEFGHRRVYFLASYDRSTVSSSGKTRSRLYCPNPGTALEALCFFVRPGGCMEEEIDFG